jgi:hypothetical protein
MILTKHRLLSSISHIALGAPIASRKYMSEKVIFRAVACTLCGYMTSPAELSQVDNDHAQFTCLECGHEAAYYSPRIPKR